VKTLFQAPGETIVINGDINITVLKIEGDEVFFEIDAPDCLSIDDGLSIDEHSTEPNANVRRLEARRAISLPAR
jgi:hypothetical protein